MNGFLEICLNGRFELNEIFLTTLFVFLSCLFSLATVITIIIIELKSETRSWVMLSYFIVSSFVLFWFTSGFFAILAGAELDTAILFRPMQGVMVAMFTTAVVFVYRLRVELSERQMRVDELKRELRDCNLAHQLKKVESEGEENGNS